MNNNVNIITVMITTCNNGHNDHENTIITMEAGNYNRSQVEIQDPKMEVLHPIRPYFLRIFP